MIAFFSDIKPENFMLKSKGDTTCIKLIDFGLSKDYAGQPIMSTPSGSVRIIFSPYKFLALLYRSRSIPAKLHIKDRLVVYGRCALYLALRQGTFPRQKRTGDHIKRGQGRVSL